MTTVTHITAPLASTRFVDTPELLACLGEVIANRKLLLNLCLISKSFNISFTPFLYAEIWFNNGNAFILLEKFETLQANSALKYTKTLDFCIDVGRLGSKDQSEGQLCQAFNEAIQIILAKTPSLTKFSWENQPLFASTVSTLHKQCPDLASLRISHPVNIEKLRGTAFEYEEYDFEDGFSELRPLFETQDLSPFKNLKVLELHDIHGNLDQARSDIVDLLITSPGLKTLSLSLNGDTVVRLDQEAQDMGEMGGYLDFFRILIDKYVAVGGQPLQLRQLTMGLSVVLWEEDDHQPAIYLGGLTDLSKLEEVYVCNNGVDTQLFFTDPDSIAWSTFTSDTCPNLRTLGLHNFTNDAKKWIQGLEPGYVSQLRIENSLGHDISQIRSALEGNDTQQSSTLRTLTLIAADATTLGEGGLLPVEMRTLQGLAISLPHSHSISKSSFLTWISMSQSLQQLCVHNSKAFTEEDTKYESLAWEIAAVAPALRYLKLDGYSWRIWRREEEKHRHLEKLDRFEERLVETFKSHRSFYVSE